MEKRKTKIIATIGPASENPDVLKKLKDRGVDFVRINLSHTRTEEIAEKIDKIQESIDTEIILDTESSQTRTGYLEKEVIALEATQEIKVHDRMVRCDENNVYIRPSGYLKQMEPGDLISIDFENVLLSVKDVSQLKEKGFIICKVVIGGVFGSNKAVVLINKTIKHSYLSPKDKEAIKIAMKKGITHFTLSFVDSKEDIQYFKKLYPAAIIYAKIENKKSLENLEDIIEIANGILIDRGDLSKEIPIEKIAIAQKIIIKKCNDKGKPVFVATHILESMTNNLQPTKAEVNDVINTILDGVSGFVLTKKTAIGKYPIETVNMLNNLCIHAESAINPQSTRGSISGLTRLEEINYLTKKHFSRLLVDPHGGILIDKTLKAAPDRAYINSLSKLKVNRDAISDAEQIAIGSFSPLRGFMNREEMESVLNNMKLTNGLDWTIPIILQVDEKEIASLEPGQNVLLADSGDGVGYAILHIEDIYRFDKEKYVKKLYGTHKTEHPGVKSILSRGGILVGGEIDLIKRPYNVDKHYEITPGQARKIFESNGWCKVAAFHTRNVIHRSHEFIQLEAMKRAKSDGLFVHPILGKKKRGDFANKLIIKCYEMMINNFYPKGKVVFGTFASYPRYAGPKEAVFTAICRKNFGCSHFIVGRDHTGVGGFYGPNDSHEIFNRFPDLGIDIIKFDNVFYCEKCTGYATAGEYYGNNNCCHSEAYHRHISGARAREIFNAGIAPPEWFMRPELSRMILKSREENIQIFVD